MSSPLTCEILRRRANVGLIVAFFVFLWLPTADTFLHLDRTPSPNENRAPARFPEFKPDFDAMRGFVSGIESYYGDHFGFRNRLVAWEHHWKWQCFRASRTTDVLVGKSGWLFFGGGTVMDDIMGNKPFTDGQLKAWRDLLQLRQDWLAQRGIRYLFVIPPDKHTIYPEHLPDWLAGAARPPRRLDQFLQYMKAHSDVRVLDLRQTLVDAKKDARIYQQTDTHWNEMGAFLACRRIVEEAAALGFDARPVPLSAFQISSKDEPSGDLALILGRHETMIEPDLPSISPKPPLTGPRIFADASLPAKSWIRGHGPLVSDNPAATGKVVMFRDSFAIHLSRFLGYSFGRVTYIWQQNWDKRIIESEKPDFVMDEMLERFVITRDPLELMKKDEQPETQVIAEQ